MPDNKKGKRKWPKYRELARIADSAIYNALELDTELEKVRDTLGRIFDPAVAEFSECEEWPPNSSQYECDVCPYQQTCAAVYEECRKLKWEKR
jgi:hypothetical protein